MNGERTVTYSSMEIGIDSPMPIYSGGLGVLGGDMIRSAAEHFSKEMLPDTYPFLRSRIFPDRIYRVRMNICSATYVKKALSEKILAVFTAGASIIAVECPVVSRCTMKEANRPVPCSGNRLHEVINRKGIEPLSRIKTNRP